MERVCVSAGVNPHSYEYTEYTLPFNEKNFNELFKQRPSKSPTSVSLTIYAEGASEKPRQITSLKSSSHHSTTYGKRQILQGLSWIALSSNYY